LLPQLAAAMVETRSGREPAAAVIRNGTHTD